MFMQATLSCALTGAPPGRGCTALHDAVRNGRDSTVELLLQHGADIGAKDNSGPGPQGEEREAFGTCRREFRAC